MKTFPGQNESSSERVSSDFRSITFCSILLMLVLIPGVVLPESAKNDSKADKITASGEATGDTTERHWNISNQSADDTKRTPGVRMVSGDSGKLMARDSSRPVSRGAAAAESATTPFWKVLFNSSTGINDTSEKPLPWDISAAGDAGAGPLPHRVKHTLAGNPPASSMIDDCIIKLEPERTIPHIPPGGCTACRFDVTQSLSINCDWKANAVSNGNWVHIDEISTLFNGRRTITYSVDSVSPLRNGGTGEIRITLFEALKATFVIIQDGVTLPPPDCMYSVSDPTLPLVPPGGGEGTFRIMRNRSDCRWNVTIPPDATWITAAPLTSPDPATNETDTLITYTVVENLPGSAQRSADITVVGTNNFIVRRFRVTQQAGAQSNCTYSVSDPTLPLVPPGGGEGTFRIMRNRSDCRWDVTIPPDATWITAAPLTSPDPATNETDTTVTYTVVENLPGSAQRSADITVVGTNNVIVRRFRVTQQPGVQPNCTYSVSPPSVTIPAQGANNQRFTVTTTPECGWEPLSDVLWIHVTAPIGVSTGNGVVSYTVDANPSISGRTGSIFVQDTAHTVVQNGAAPGSDCTFAVSPVSADVKSKGDSLSFTVTTTPAAGCPWTAVSSVPWIKTTSSGSGSGTVNYTVDPNSDASSRRGIITVQDKIHTVTQAGATQPAACTVTLVPQKAFVGEISASYGFEVNAECSWRATPGNDWIIIEKKSSSGNGKGIVLFTVTENPKGADERTGTISVGDKIYEIVQAAPGSCPSSNTKPPARIISVGQTIYGALSLFDCVLPSPKSGFIVDRYLFEIGTQGRRVAINVASSSRELDPKVSLLEQTPQGIEDPVKDGNGNDVFDDDGAAFRNVRIPRLPQKDAKDEFLFLKEGKYIIEVTSFSVSMFGNYGLLINPEDAQSDPKILGDVTDATTLIVTGENFKQEAQLFIDAGEGLEKQKKTQNDKSRTRTALIALTSARKVNKVPRGCATLQVRNPGPDGKVSDVFVFGICDPDK